MIVVRMKTHPVYLNDYIYTCTIDYTVAKVGVALQFLIYQADHVPRHVDAFVDIIWDVSL